MQIKNTVRCHFTPIRMASIKKTINKCWWGCGGKRTPVHCWWECKLVQSLRKTVWRFLKKLKIELSYNRAVLLHKSSSIYLKKKKVTPVQKDICTPMFITALFTIAEIWKQPMCPLMDEQIKMWIMWYTSWNITQP